MPKFYQSIPLRLTETNFCYQELGDSKEVTAAKMWIKSHCYLFIQAKLGDLFFWCDGMCRWHAVLSLQFSSRIATEKLPFLMLSDGENDRPFRAVFLTVSLLKNGKISFGSFEKLSATCCRQGVHVHTLDSVLCTGGFIFTEINNYALSNID